MLAEVQGMYSAKNTCAWQLSSFHIINDSRNYMMYLETFRIRERDSIYSLQALTVCFSSPIWCWSLIFTRNIKSEVPNIIKRTCSSMDKKRKNTLRQAKALTKEVFGMCGPRQRSTKGPHLYTVMVLSSGNSLIISTYSSKSIQEIE
jgi:hypothetical protein